MKSLFAAIIVFIVIAITLLALLSMDACLDAGGRWSHLGFICTSEQPNFIPQYQRSAPLFWAFVILVSALPSVLFYKLLTKTKT